jgi:hypothetical protein
VRFLNLMAQNFMSLVLLIMLSTNTPQALPPTTPANGETDVYTFYTDDGGTTYYGFQTGDALA